MKLKNIMLVIAGVTLGVALSASVLKVAAVDTPEDVTAAALKKLVEQNEKLLGGQEAMMKDIATIKADVQFLKARSGQ
jgi:hypothetical protein